MKNKFWPFLIFTILSSCKKDNSPSSTVTICDQIWMVKNLDVRNYRNGDPIPEVTEQSKWVELTSGAWCWYNNDSAKYGKIYGRLYNWYAVNDPRGLAPEGWHIPSDEEWARLSACLGGDLVAGGKLKERGLSHWLPPNTNATNESGFTALPGEARHFFSNLWPIPESMSKHGGWGHWWSSTENGPAFAFERELMSFGGNFYREITGSRKENGYSVRCLKD